jgi:hypothetical protein
VLVDRGLSTVGTCRTFLVSVYIFPPFRTVYHLDCRELLDWRYQRGEQRGEQYPEQDHGRMGSRPCRRRLVQEQWKTMGCHRCVVSCVCELREYDDGAQVTPTMARVPPVSMLRSSHVILVDWPSLSARSPVSTRPI